MKIAPLLESLYSIDGRPESMQPFLALLGHAFSSHIAVMQFYDPSNFLTSFNMTTGVARSWVELAQTSDAENLWMTRGAGDLVSKGVLDDEGLTTEAELVRSRFFQDSLAPVDIRHSFAWCLWSNDQGHLAAITVNRSRATGMYSPQERRFAREILPHMRNAYALQRRLSWVDTLALGYRAALDHLDCGVLLLDRRGCVIFQNVCSQQQSSIGMGATIFQGRIKACWKSEQSNLTHLVDVVCTSLAATPSSTMLLSDATGQRIASICVLPIPATLGSSWNESRARAIAFVTKLGKTSIPSEQRLRSLYGLTQAEAVLAQLLCHGFTAETASIHLNKRKSTVRVQMKSLFEKTGVHRHVELVGLLSSLAGRFE